MMEIPFHFAFLCLFGVRLVLCGALGGVLEGGDGLIIYLFGCLWGVGIGMFQERLQYQTCL